jgi:DNA-binding MarR family transcriptional regulator
MAQPAPSQTTISANDLLTLLRRLQSIDPEFPIQYAVCLLEISQDEGMSLTTLAEKTHLALSTVSRIIGALSDHRQKGTPYGLIEVTISKTERRRKELKLSAKGRKIITSLTQPLTASAA